MKIENNSVIYMPGFSGIHLVMNNINWLTSIYTDNTYQFTNNKADLTFQKPTYTIQYDQYTNTIWMAKLDSNYHTSEIVLLSNDGFDDTGVIVQQYGINEIYINNISAGIYGNSANLPISGTVGKVASIIGTELIASNINIVKGSLLNNELYSLEFGPGVYAEEIWGTNKTHWCQSKGEIIINNNSNSNANVQLVFTSATGTGEKANLQITDDGDITSFEISGTQSKCSVNVSVNPGKNVLKFICNAEPLVSATDSREMVFYIMDTDVVYSA